MSESTAPDGAAEASGGGRESRASTDAVVLDGVRKEYDLGGTVTALAGVDLRLPRGSFTAVMGPSGSGKSTLLNLVGALDTPTTGEVVVDGQSVGGLSERERARLRGTEVGFVFQTFNLMPRLDAVENVALPLSFAGVDRDRRQERAQTLLADVGLGDRTDHLPRELSGGQRQRVAIARALAADPSLVLADEPTGNVDTDTGETIMSLIEGAADRGTVLLVTHERRIAEHADRIVHVRDGRLERVEAVADDADPQAIVPGDVPVTERGDGANGGGSHADRDGGAG